MKKILSSVLLASFLSFSSFAVASTNDLDQVLSILDGWADQYPQCYQDVADIKQAIDELRYLLSDVVAMQISAFHSDFSNLHGELSPLLVSFDTNLNKIFEVSSSHFRDVSAYLEKFYTDSGSIQGYLADIVSYLSSSYDSYYLGSINDILHTKIPELIQLITDNYSKLPDFNSWSPDVKVSNFSDIKEILRELFNEITVFAHCTLDSDASIKVQAQFDFDYDFFSPVKLLSEKANRGYFSLNTYTRYHPHTWLYNPNDPMDYLVTPVPSSTVGVDFLDFLCSCGNALVSQNEDISMLLCQLLGFFKSGHEDQDELKRMATTAADGASQDLDSLKSVFHASSLEDVASMYFVDLNIDDKLDTDFLDFGQSSGNHCPDFIDIGPIPFSKIHSSMTDYTLHFSTSGLLSFFDICRQCFTVVWYLFFLTICIFLARFGWAFLKPIFRTLISVLNW